MRVVATAAVAALVAVPAAAAGQPAPAFKFRPGEEIEQVADTEWGASAEVGVVLTTGNTETTTATGGGKVSRRSGRNKLELMALTAYARVATRVAVDRNGNGTIGPGEITSQDKTTAQTIEGRLRYDRYLSARHSVYAAALARRDVPAGKEFAGGGQVGYSRVLKKTVRTEVVAEGGYDFSVEKLVGTTEPIPIHSVRVLLGYKGQVATDSLLEASIEGLTNINALDTPTGRVGTGSDGRLNARVAWTSKVGTDLALVFSLDYKFDAAPAPLKIAGVTFEPGYVPEASKLDALVKGSIIYSFF